MLNLGFIQSGGDSLFSFKLSCAPNIASEDYIS